MRALIISNGIIDNYDKVKEYFCDDTLVVCADGGGDHAIKMGMVPKVLIGDGDSVSQETLKILKEKGTEMIFYPCEKDETDTQLAVEYAVEKGAKEITMFGCIGDRFDHTYGNVSLLIWLMRRGLRGKIINDNNEIHVIDRYLEIEGEPGEKISLLPITPCISGIFTKGLKYELQDGELCYDSPRGISNEFINNCAEIVIRDGMLMVVKVKN